MNRAVTYILFSLFIATNAFAQVQTNEEVAGKSAYIEGIEALASDDYETARDHLLQAYEKLETAAGVTYALADVYMKMGDLSNAAHYGKKAVAGRPDSKWYRMKLAEIYRSAGQNEAALSELTTLLEYHPTDFEALYMLADSYENYGELLKANKVLDRILTITGPDISLYLVKLQNFERLSLPDSALVVLEQIRKADPDNLHTLNLLGEYYAKTGKEDQAKNVLDEALDRNARDPQTIINLAGIFLEEEKWDSAGTLIADFVADSLVNADEKLSIAQFLLSHVQQQPENAQLQASTNKVLKSFVESEPEFGPAFTISGQFYAQTGQVEKALQNLKTANQLQPFDNMAWRQRLQLLLSQSRLDEAIETGKTADQNVPDDAFIQFFTGSAFMLKNEFSEAEHWLEKASRAPARRPFKSLIYGSLADVRANKEDFEGANKAYELALRYDPENDNVLNNYASYLAESGESLEKAKELALQALELAPNKPSYLDTTGWIYFKLGEYDEAKIYLKAAIDSGEVNAVVFERLGDVFEKLDNHKEAQKWWKKAYEMDSTKTHLQSKLTIN